MRYYSLFTNSLKSSVYFISTAHFIWDQPHFKRQRECPIFSKLPTTLYVHGPQSPKPCPLTVRVGYTARSVKVSPAPQSSHRHTHKTPALGCLWASGQVLQAGAQVLQESSVLSLAGLDARFLRTSRSQGGPREGALRSCRPLVLFSWLERRQH